MNNGENKSMTFIRNLIRNVKRGNPEEFLNQLKEFMSGIPYYLSKNKPEIYFENNIFIIFKILGFAANTEYHTSNGRMDLLIATDSYVYVILVPLVLWSFVLLFLWSFGLLLLCSFAPLVFWSFGLITKSGKPTETVSVGFPDFYWELQLKISEQSSFEPCCPES
ncbi:MAG: hypothetical protein NC548_57785 [Lachnospiraceae bacterium]|nr:hypothetical protein [Lachnospiraceae bacterium]